MDYCVKNKKSKTCYKKNTLIKIAEKYNENNDDKININSKNLYELIKNKLNKDSPCNKEVCWLNIDYLQNIKEDILGDLRPIVPEEWYTNNKTWLNTLDIMNVMKQYEDKHQDFIFLGASPSDYDYITHSNQCVSDKLCKFNLEKHLNNGKKKIGIIFNTDEHNKSGQHWVSMFIDLNKCAIYYVDSVGELPLDNFLKFMNKVKKQGDDLIYKNKININNINNDYSILQNCKQIHDKIICVEDSKVFKIDNIVNLCKDEKKLNKSNNFKIKNIYENNLLLNKKINNNCNKILQKTFRIFYSNNKHQYKNSECGMYSIHFLDNMINDIDFFDYVNNRNSDKYMNELRFSKYFLPVNLIPN